MVEALYAGGMTDGEIAEQTGISQATINRIRNGMHAEPKHSTWVSINTLYLQRQAALASGAEGGHAAQ
jgi:transcriptional regulator with XRE-family HTH domain